MKQYRPNVERAKWLYSMRQSRAWVKRQQGRPEGNSRVARGLPPIPDNSEPWLPGGVRSMADAIWISDQIKQQDTGRDKDLQDIAFLEAKIEREYLEKLPSADEQAALDMIGRFLTPKVAEATIAHPSPTVRDLGMRFLHEFAE